MWILFHKSRLSFQTHSNLVHAYYISPITNITYMRYLEQTLSIISNHLDQLSTNSLLVLICIHTNDLHCRTSCVNPIPISNHQHTLITWLANNRLSIITHPCHINLSYTFLIVLYGCVYLFTIEISVQLLSRMEKQLNCIHVRFRYRVTTRKTIYPTFFNTFIQQRLQRITAQVVIS